MAAPVGNCGTGCSFTVYDITPDLTNITNDVSKVKQAADKTAAPPLAMAALQAEAARLNTTMFPNAPLCGRPCECADLNPPNVSPWPGASFDSAPPGVAGWTLSAISALPSGEAGHTCPATVRTGLLLGICRSKKKILGTTFKASLDDIPDTALLFPNQQAIEFFANYEGLKLARTLSRARFVFPPESLTPSPDDEDLLIIDEDVRLTPESDVLEPDQPDSPDTTA